METSIDTQVGAVEQAVLAAQVVVDAAKIDLAKKEAWLAAVQAAQVAVKA